MATQGELSYHHFVLKLSQKASTRYVSNSDIQSIGDCFWSLMDKDFKDLKRETEKRKAFWTFALYLKKCLINRDVEAIFDLWGSFDINGRNMWESMYENCIQNHVDNVL